jgi:PAS domain S-box-containing protein
VSASGAGLNLARRLAARLSPVATGIALVISLGIPGSYYLIESADLHRTATRNARELAEQLGQFAIQTPTLWKYQATKYVQVVTAYLAEKDIISIQVKDEAGQPVTAYGHETAEGVRWWNWGAPTAAAPIRYNNRQIGEVRVVVGQGRFVGVTLALFMLSTVLGIVLAMIVYRFPTAVVRDMEGQIEDLVRTVEQERDESARFQREAQAAARRFQDLIQGLDAIVWEADPATFQCRFVSRRAEAILGYPVQQWLTQADFWVGHLHPGDRDQAVAAHYAAVADGRSYECEYRMLAADGREVWLHDVGGLVRGLDEEEARLRGVMVDVTAHKHVEAALRARTRQLDAVRGVNEEIARELELTRLLDLLLERALALTEAASGTIRLWEANRELLVPIASQNVQPQPLRLGEGVSGEVAQRRKGLLLDDFPNSAYARLHPPEGVAGDAVLAEPLLHRDELVGVITVGRDAGKGPFPPEAGQLLRLFTPAAAIAIENARLFEALKHAYNELRRVQEESIRAEKLRALGQMSAGVAHDLNNMLAAVLGQIDLLRLRVSDPAVREALNTVEVAATDGAHVVRRLQDFARQQTNQSLLAPVDLKGAVRDVLDITSPRWKDEPQQRGVVIEAEVGLDDLPCVLGDASEIREALTNLILNAVDAMPAGGTLTITGRAQGPAADQPLIALTVADTGVGMPEDVRRRIFDPFFTTKGVTGTGLGLSVVYGIMQRHGGRIDVASVPGKGTTFTLWFQMAPDAAKPVPRPAAVHVVAPRRLLVIDDEPVVRQTVVDMLQSVGHVVTAAAGGAEGLQVLQQHAVDLVLTDLGMPGMSGWDVVRAVKKTTPNVPVILLTGWGEQAASVLEQPGLADRIVGKPVRLDELLTTIHELTTKTSVPDESNKSA